VYYTVHSLVQEQDGKLLVGGDFDTLDGAAQNYLVRLSSDGDFDDSFDARPDDMVHSIVVLPDGKVMLGGDFTVLSSVRSNYIGRVNIDGTLDPTFP
jgi:hypothetical protein